MGGEDIHNAVWSLTEHCWMEQPSGRPSAQTVADHLECFMDTGDLGDLNDKSLPRREELST